MARTEAQEFNRRPGLSDLADPLGAALSGGIVSTMRVETALAVAMGTLLAALAAGCKDDIADPTLGSVEVRLSSSTVDGYKDGTVRIQWATGDTTFVATSPVHSIHGVPPGAAQASYEKECTRETPSGSLTIHIDPGRTSEIRWNVESTAAGVRVESSPMSGAEVLLDDQPTGQFTPTTLECLSPGTYSISLALAGSNAAPAQEATVGASGLTELDFELTPASQTRGAVTELLTATECAPCGVIDIAAEEVWLNQELVEKHGITLEIHHRWQPPVLPDAIYTDATHARNVFYGAGGGGHPWRITNGVTRFQGTSNRTIPELVALITSELESYLDDAAPPVSLHWMSVVHEPGTSLRGVLRVVIVDPVANPADTHVIAMNYKHNLPTFVRIHGREETFYRVVRDIQDHGSLQDLGLVQAGDWRDLEFVFDLSGDLQWSEDGMGVVGLVQEMTGPEILQVRHRRVDQ
jgi:hypothetical protein